MNCELDRGSPFLALVHDSAPAAKRGLAISLAQIILIIGFAREHQSSTPSSPLAALAD